MRYLLCFVFLLLCGAPLQAQARLNSLTPEEIAQGKVLLFFDGKATSGWVIQGDAKVKDGVLILGGNQKTRARIAADFSPQFELHLEYSTDNNKPIQFELHSRHFLGQGMHSVSLDGTSRKPGEWIEAIFLGKETGNGFANNSKWRVVGEPAFREQQQGGSASLPRSVFVAFDIPVGQKLYLRNVRVKTDLVSSLPWLPVILAAALVALLLIALVARAIVKKRRTPTQSDDHGRALTI